MAVLVQKYGGTSVGDADKIKTVAQRIAASRAAGNEIAVVVSAMGKTTDHLIALADTVSSAPEPRELDLLLSTGEVVSSTLMAMALREIGVPSISMGGAQAGIRTDTAHGRASIVHLDPARIRKELDSGKVVIIAGFQGINEEMDITTLGRGGSDTTAVALAVGAAAGSALTLRLAGARVGAGAPSAHASVSVSTVVAPAAAAASVDETFGDLDLTTYVPRRRQ